MVSQQYKKKVAKIDDSVIKSLAVLSEDLSLIPHTILSGL